MTAHEDREALGSLSDFIRSRQETLVVEWMAQARALSPATELSRPVLLNHLPEILACIADLVETAHTGASVPLGEGPRQHALDRLTQGFDLEEVIKEYGLLRQCVLSLWERDVASTITVSETS